jgi:protein gp37
MTNYYDRKWNPLKSESSMTAPLRWRKPGRVMIDADLYNGLADEGRDKIMAAIALCPKSMFVMLTRHPDRMVEYLLEKDNRFHGIQDAIIETTGGNANVRRCWQLGVVTQWPLPNLWLASIARNQDEADERYPTLLQIPAAKRIALIQPMEGPADFSAWFRCRGCGYTKMDDLIHCDHYLCRSPTPRLDWVIVFGGEKPVHPDWVRSIRDQCLSAEVPFWFDGWGKWVPVDMPWGQDSPQKLDRENEQWLNLAGGSGYHGDKVYRMRRVGKSRSGRLLDGRTWEEVPE